MRKIFVTITVALAALGNAQADPGNSVVILGDVLGNDGKPVAGTKVYVTNVCTNKTIEIGPNAERGSFEFSGDYCATYILEAKAQGYTSVGQVLDLQTESIFTTSLKLEAEKSQKKAPEEAPVFERKPENK